MEFAIHMKNSKTGRQRIKKVVADDVSKAICNDFYYGSEWTWEGTEPWNNIYDSLEHIGNEYYIKLVPMPGIEKLPTLKV